MEHKSKVKDGSKSSSDKQLMEKISYTTKYPSEQYSAEKSFEALWERIVSNSKSGQKVRKPLLLQWRTVAAAAVLALLLGTSAIYLINRQSFNTQLTTYAANEKREQFTLPDGSLVWLNAMSSLTYDQRFGKENRKVSLIGGAYFEVTNNKEKPFIVRANNINIQVLGTIFDVAAYPDQTNIVTTLLEGSVQVYKQGLPAEEGVRLFPNQQLVYNKIKDDIAIQNVDSRLFASWKDGVLLFDQTPIDDVFSVIEHNYHVQITSTNRQLHERKITGRFSTDYTHAELLEILQKVVPFSFISISGDSIVLY